MPGHTDLPAVIFEPGNLDALGGVSQKFLGQVGQDDGGDSWYFTDFRGMVKEARAGAVLAVDWMDMRDLGVSICGVKLDHLMFHAVLPYSNWQWALRCRSESLLSIRSGLKATIGRLGWVPMELLLDNSSAATHPLSGKGNERGVNEEFLSVCEHFGLSPRTTTVGRAQENGTCEVMHGHLKRRLEQHLLLRGSRDFESEEAYDLFVIGVLEKANGLRGERFAQEMTAMREHLAPELPDYTETMVRVNNNSTIRVCKRVYSVPSKLIGSRLRVRIRACQKVCVWVKN